MNPQQSRAHAAYAPFPCRKPTAEGLSQKVMAEKSSAMPSMPDAGFYIRIYFFCCERAETAGFDGHDHCTESLVKKVTRIGAL